MASLDAVKSYEAKSETNEQKKHSYFEEESLTERISRILGDAYVDPEIDKAAEKAKADMDIRWVKENEVSEGKIDLNATPVQEEVSVSEPVIEGSVDEVVEEVKQEEPQMDRKTMEFTEYAKSLMEKYHSNDYHRMMNAMETKEYVDLYAIAYNVNRSDAMAMVEDTIEQQVTRDKTEDEIKQQGLEQQKLTSLYERYKSQYGDNFMAYLGDEDLEKYEQQYLHAYFVRRKDVEKMYENSVNKAYAESMVDDMVKAAYNDNEGDEMQTGRNRGFSAVRTLILVASVFVIAAGAIGIYLFVK